LFSGIAAWFQEQFLRYKSRPYRADNLRFKADMRFGRQIFLYPLYHANVLGNSARYYQIIFNPDSLEQ
jgi:hypothetical protein